MNMFNYFATLESMKLFVLPLSTNTITLVFLIWPNNLRVFCWEIPVIAATEGVGVMLASSFPVSSLFDYVSEEGASLDSSSSLLSLVLLFLHKIDSYFYTYVMNANYGNYTYGMDCHLFSHFLLGGVVYKPTNVVFFSSLNELIFLFDGLVPCL